MNRFCPTCGWHGEGDGLPLCPACENLLFAVNCRERILMVFPDGNQYFLAADVKDIRVEGDSVVVDFRCMNRLKTSSVPQ